MWTWKEEVSSFTWLLFLSCQFQILASPLEDSKVSCRYLEKVKSPEVVEATSRSPLLKSHEPKEESLAVQQSYWEESVG